MLAKRFRLTHREFLLAKKAGHTIPSQFLSLVVTPDHLPYTRFAVVTSTKLSKKAVVRNRLRRKLYDLLGKLPAAGLDVLVFPKASMLKLDDAELGTQTNSLLSTLSRLA